MKGLQVLFETMIAEGSLTATIWQELQEIALQRGLEAHEAQSFLSPQASILFEQTLAACEQTDMLEQKDEQYLSFLQTAFALDDHHFAALQARFARLQRLMAVRRGDFEPIEVAETLDADEEAYYTCAVIYLSTEKRKTKPNEPEPGEWLITNKFLYFKRPGARGMPIKWRTILATPLDDLSRIRLDVMQGSGGGYYTIEEDDPTLVKAYLDTLIKRAKHHLPPRITHKRPDWQHYQKSPNSKYDSLAEEVFFSCWTYPGLPLERQYHIQTTETTYRVDFAHLPTKTIIEIDGFEGHSKPESIRHDHRRQRALERLGWRFIRFSGLEIRDDPQQATREARTFIVKGREPPADL
ncbi:MAG: endonuclease domain-containing protein [Ktedonobacteraceae bacterium]